MSNNLNDLLKQRAEATGVAGDRVPFEFGDKTFTFRDPMLLTDEDKDDLAGLSHDVDVAEFYMGADQYDDFIATTATIELDNGEKLEVEGSSSVFMLAFREYVKGLADVDEKGNPMTSNRSSRRAAARSQRKRR
ncbi:hypothetical protein [Corynebacterium mastitidis]|uniref:hypothetical protein n=1 Tax=Corynebacterium mastitidis TaxID=161890 RepID=UPI000361650A|nr:hypothetical protein [Corynebacterium mastitidis]